MVKNIFGQKSPKMSQSFLYIYVSTECFLTFMINYLFLKNLTFFVLKKKNIFSLFKLKRQSKAIFIIIRFYHLYFADT